MSWVWWVSAALGSIGLMGMIYKKTMLGLIVSAQIMILGASALFVFSSDAGATHLEDGHSFAVFVVIAGVVQVVGGYALATRMFYLKNGTEVGELRNLKR